MDTTTDEEILADKLRYIAAQDAIEAREWREIQEANERSFAAHKAREAEQSRAREAAYRADLANRLGS